MLDFIDMTVLGVKKGFVLVCSVQKDVYIFTGNGESFVDVGFSSVIQERAHHDNSRQNIAEIEVHLYTGPKVHLLLY